MQAFVPKNRRPKFQLRLRILDLNNVPLVSGTSFIRWDLPHSAAAEHSGRTSKCNIKDHKVFYNYDKTVPVRLVVDKNNMLQDTLIRFDVTQEYSGTARGGEKIALGNVKLNLAEYVDASDYDTDENEEGVCRRYLMQDSKINSTLKVGIHMKLVEGEQNFIAPSLKTAPVFGGIAGIVAGEQGDNEDPGVVPSLTSKTREAGEAQDLYRRNLAAFWTAQPGELRADDCIEDIFAGGDGWSKADQQPEDSSPRKKTHARDFDKDKPDWTAGSNHSHKNSYHERHYSRELAKGADSGSPKLTDLKISGPREDTNPVPSGVGGRGSLEQQANEMKAEAESRKGHSSHEVDEFDVREDLKSWKLPDTVA